MDEEQEPKAMDEGEENKLTKAKTKSKLSEDVTYGIAEKMFFKKPFSNPTLMSEIDLTKQNPYTIFMGHCQVHLNAMMAQFAKLKRIEFSKSNNGKDVVSFYKYKEGNSNSSNLDIKDAFSGPYRVTKPMAFGVIEYGKLRVSAIHTTYYLKKKAISAADNDQIHQQQRPIEAFSSLFLDNNMSDSEEIAQHYQLNIEQLVVDECPADIEANLRSLLALDSVEILLNSETGGDYSESFFFGCSMQSNVRATRTKKISVHFDIAIAPDFWPAVWLDSVGTKWRQQARFLVNCCPSLELLEFELSSCFLDDFVPEHILPLIGGFYAAIRELLEQMNGGGDQLRVCIKFTNNCQNWHIVQMLTALDNSNQEQMFTQGTPFQVDHYEREGSPPYVARSITIVDTAGRPHQCKLVVGR